jgi:hypothetical protein
MSTEAGFGYISDDLGNGVDNAHGVFTSVWAQNLEAGYTGELEDRLSVRLEALRGFAPEVEELIEQGWEQLGFKLEVTSYNAAAVDDYVEDYQGERFERSEELDPGIPDDVINDGLAVEAQKNLDEDAGAQAHLVLSRALRVPTADHVALTEKITAQGQELPLGLTAYHGPFLTAALNETRSGDRGNLHVETHHAGYPTLLEDPEKAAERPNVDADFLPIETWQTMTRLRNKLYDAAVTHMGERIVAEAAMVATD